MTSLPLLLSLLSHSQPMDTGLVVRACLGTKSTEHVLFVRVWNASARPVSDLRLRLHLNGAPGSMNELGWRALEETRFEAGGLASTATVSVPDRTVPPVLAVEGCAQNSCAQVVDLPLGDLVLAPLEGLGMDLHPARILSSGALPLDWAEPTRLPHRGDWSFSNLDSSAACAEKTDAGTIARATRIELYSGAIKLWGNAPGASYERPDWPLADFRKASFASLMRTPSDTVPVRERDLRNLKLGRWLVNQAGYRLSDVKAGLARVRGVGVDAWTVIDRSGTTRGNGVAKSLGSRISGRVAFREYDGSLVKILDSTGPARRGTLTEFVLPRDLVPADGPYRVVSESDTSAPFSVDEDLYGKLRDASLRYFGVQRAGNSSSWFRPASFVDDPVPGGWFDCGDHLKEGITMGFAMEVLGALAATHPERDPDRTSWLQSSETPDGISEMVRELRHGAEFALASWDLSGKNPASMVTAVGDYSPAHQAWVHDTWVGLLPKEKGGPASRLGRKELGGNVAGAWAAGLAFASRLERMTDPVFADRALEAAKGIYAWGKGNQKVVNPMGYNDGESVAELALAAVALLWATRDTAYLHDLVANDSIAKPRGYLWPSAVVGGWMAKSASGSGMPLDKLGWYMDWSSPHPLALHAFVRLILPHPDTAVRYGVAGVGRYDTLRDLALAGAIRNLRAISSGTWGVQLPGEMLRLDSTWFFPVVSLQWGSSRYVAANVGEMLLYADLARSFQERPSPRYPVGTAFLADSVEASAVRGMDYLLGQNPWDMSFLMGIGSRNLNHIHHRTANPEGRNPSSVDWAYRTPVGALVGGGAPDDSILLDQWENYTHSESCLDFAASFLVPATLLASPTDSSTASVHPFQHAATAPRWSWNSRTGVLGWTGAPAGVRWEVLDARGRVVASGSTTGPEGRESLAVPVGVSVLRWRSLDSRGTLPLLRVSR